MRLSSNIWSDATLESGCSSTCKGTITSLENSDIRIAARHWGPFGINCGAFVVHSRIDDRVITVSCEFSSLNDIRVPLFLKPSSLNDLALNGHIAEAPSEEVFCVLAFLMSSVASYRDNNGLGRAGCQVGFDSESHSSL